MFVRNSLQFCCIALQQLNWATRPAKGDIQINWRYELPNGVPYGLKCRLLAICERCITAYKYKHGWKDGVLFRIGEVTMICICAPLTSLCIELLLLLPARRSKRRLCYGNVAGWLAGWLAVTAGIVSKRLNLS